MIGLTDTQLLIRNLQQYTLDPVFEKYGNFILSAAGHRTLFWGNFYDYSAVFSIKTNDPKEIDVLTKLIRANQETKEYQYAKDEYDHPGELR